MAEIHTFSAVLYHPETGSDITQFVAPPYDVIGEDERPGFRERSPHNVVRLILPEGADDRDRYQQAAWLYREWLEKGVLKADTRPRLYVWEHEFTLAGATVIRRALAAKVTCGPYQPRGVMRHELTHKGPKADRLALFEATGAQFSQMFGIVPDHTGEVRELLAAATAGEARQAASAGNGQHSRLFDVDEPSAKRIQQLLAGETITMADGHHRYETTQAYYQRKGRPGSALMTLVPGSDPGLVVLPTHRITAVPLMTGDLANRLAPGITAKVQPLELWTALFDGLVNVPAAGGLVAVAPGESKCVLISPSNSNGSQSVAGNCDADFLHEAILPRLAEAGQGVAREHIYRHEAEAAVREAAERGEWAFLLRPVSVETLIRVAREHIYRHEAEAAVREAAERGDWAFLLRPVSVETLIRVAHEQAVLPAKSTYFYPKFMSGFVNAALD